jgi:ribonuclease P protein component
MFSKKQRLNTSLFNEVFNFGKTKNTEMFLLKFKENNLDIPRFAVTISKKKIPSAVKRHFLKRRFMNALKKSELMKTNKDFVFVLNQNILDKKENEIILTINDLRLE